MRQQVTVTRLIDAQYAEVMLRRQSACSGDCHKCGGCTAAEEVIHVRARNAIGAKPGDTVIVETAGKTVLQAALLVYLVPLVLFFIGWAIGTRLVFPGLFAAAGFVLGMIPALVYNRHLTNKKPVSYTITAFG